MPRDQAQSFKSKSSVFVRKKMIDEAEHHLHEEQAMHIAEQHRAEDQLEQKIRARRSRRAGTSSKKLQDIRPLPPMPPKQAHQYNAIEEMLTHMLDEHVPNVQGDDDEKQLVGTIQDALFYVRDNPSGSAREVVGVPKPMKHIPPNKPALSP